MLGAASDLLPELTQLVSEYPLREAMRSSLIVAQYRAGQQAEALRSYERLRTNLAELLGLDPSPELRELQLRVLSQDPSLLVTSMEAPTADRTARAVHVDNVPAMSGYGDPAARVYTVMLTDIEESVQLWERFPDDTAAALSRHLTLAADAVTREGGTPLQTMGDGCSPSSPLPAPRCEVPSRSNETCVVTTGGRSASSAFGYGSTQESAGCRATTPSATCRTWLALQTAGHGGQILLSRETAMAASLDPPPDIQLRQLGYFSLRGFDEPIEVHTAVAEGLRSDLPPLPRPRPVPERCRTTTSP